MSASAYACARDHEAAPEQGQHVCRQVFAKDGNEVQEQLDARENDWLEYRIATEPAAAPAYVVKEADNADWIADPGVYSSAMKEG